MNGTPLKKLSHCSQLAAPPRSTPTTSTNIVLIGNFTDFYITNSPPSIRWQWDDIRENNRLAEAESKAALEFQRTNTWTGPTNYLFYAQTHYHRPLRATTNDVELGFRSDGMVLWRTPPEAKP